MTDLNEILKFDQAFSTIEDEYDLKGVISSFSHLNHPYYYYKIAETYYLSFDNYSMAKPYIKKAIQFGLKHNNPYNGTAFADSIAQCMLMYIDNETTLSLIEQFKLSCLCYVYFSQLIDKHGTNAYNSYFSRAIFLRNNKREPGTLKMIKEYYYSGDDLCIEMLTFGDFYQAMIGFEDAGEDSNVERAQGYAEKDLTLMKSLPQYANMALMSESQIANLSIRNSEYLSEKLIGDFKNGKFEF
jgi:hypothetical protein